MHLFSLVMFSLVLIRAKLTGVDLEHRQIQEKMSKKDSPDKSKRSCFSWCFGSAENK